MKERDKLDTGSIFEGIVSFRAVLSSVTENKSDRKITKVYYDRDKIRKKSKEFSFIKAKSFELGYELILTDRECIDSLALGNTHGGLVFECTERTYPSINETDPENRGFYVYIEGIEDPYNFGYALRSLYAAGADGVILPLKTRYGADGIVCRASAGASEYLNTYTAEDESFLSKLKNKGYTIICADKENSIPMYDADMKKPVLLIIGGERRGISANVLKQADHIVRIDYGRAFPAALSAASASTVLAFEVYRQNRTDN